MYVKKVSLSTKPAKQYRTIKDIAVTKLVTRFVFTYELDNYEIDFYHYFKLFLQTDASAEPFLKRLTPPR